MAAVTVYIRRSPTDGSVYATTQDFSKFIMEPPLETVRLPEDTWESDPRLIEKLKIWSIS
jgi:hypothetical protein